MIATTYVSAMTTVISAQKTASVEKWASVTTIVNCAKTMTTATDPKKKQSRL
jgi:hypothetical protein